MVRVCCVTCRLVQPVGTVCVDCGGTRLVAPSSLTKPIVSGVTAVAKQPATGWRDSVALLATSLGVCAGVGVGALITHGVFGAVVGASAVGMLGYNKQFWRTAFRRSVRVSSVAMLPAPPAADPIRGVVKAYEKHVGDGDAVAIATAYLFDDEVIARTIEAVPFWLIDGDRRVLVDGPLRVTRASAKPMARTTAVKQLGLLGVQVRRADRERIWMTETVLRPDVHVTAAGPLTARQLADGYRDNLVDAFAGEPGRPVSITVNDPADLETPSTIEPGWL
jgi:hypothetical protein